MGSTEALSSKVKWTDIFQEGLLVDLDISYWSGRKKLSLPELGVKPKDAKDAGRFKDLFNLGTKRLIQKERIDDFVYWGNRARTVLDKMSVRFPIGKARYVPQPMLEDLMKALGEIKAEFDEKVAKFLEDYSDLRDKMLDLYEEHADAIWEKHREELPDADGDKFTERFVTPIALAYPGKGKISSMFNMEWHTYSISAPAIPGVGKDQTEKINTFLDQVVVSLREEVTKYFEHVAGMIDNDQRFTEKTMKALRSKIQRFRTLNFLGDGKVDEQLKELEKGFLKGASAKDIRGSSEQLSALRNALKSCSNNVKEAGPVQHPRFGALGARKLAKPSMAEDDSVVEA